VTTSDVPAAPPKKRAKSRLGVISLGIGFVVCFTSLLVPHSNVQGPVLRGVASPKELDWYFFLYTLPGLCGLIALFEGFRFRRRDPEAMRHVDDGTPVTMAVAALMVVYSLVDTLLVVFFVF
jgi:hypothetical protein